MDKRFIDYCRYYKGENECVSTNPNVRMFWDYERIWCEMQKNKNDANNIKLMASMVDDYNLHNLADFESFDGTPLSLKALLFNRFTNYMEMPYEDFKTFYTNVYVNGEEIK